MKNVPASPATARPRRPARDEARTSINLRLERRTRELIDEAASALGKTRTEFMVETARSSAIDVLLDKRLLMLEARDFDAFRLALDNAPSPGPKLLALLRRSPAWER